MFIYIWIHFDFGNKTFFEGGLVDHQSCVTQNLKFLAVREPAFPKSKFDQNRPLTGFCMYIGPASTFFIFSSLPGFELVIM